MKKCPKCIAINRLEAKECTCCGYSFDPPDNRENFIKDMIMKKILVLIMVLCSACLANDLPFVIDAGIRLANYAKANNLTKEQILDINETQAHNILSLSYADKNSQLLSVAFAVIKGHACNFVFPPAEVNEPNFTEIVAKNYPQAVITVTDSNTITVKFTNVSLKPAELVAEAKKEADLKEESKVK